MPDPICPDCGAPMVLRSSPKFRYRSGEPRKFFGCSRFPECTATHCAHPDGKPMGTPADTATKQARIRAHGAFDQLWKGPSAPMSPDDAHIGRFTAEQCEQLIERLRLWSDGEIQPRLIGGAA
ncbi:MAG: topoisomerase DNA-binding C4 zinc finger domain-containing protein [Phycisphaerae bacterium]|nr:topoisomerase DNA-binding C4 zinc finger domain-containing protein [Phycisphaerae bacterium]